VTQTLTFLQNTRAFKMKLVVLPGTNVKKMQKNGLHQCVDNSLEAANPLNVKFLQKYACFITSD